MGEPDPAGRPRGGGSRREPASALPSFFELVAWSFVVLLPITDFPLAGGPLLVLLVAAPYLLLVSRRGRLPWPLVWLAVLALYQLASALILGMPPGNLLEFDFLRRDAKFYIAYAPLAVGALLGLGLPALLRQLRALIYVTTAIAAAGIVEYALALTGIGPGLFVGRSPGGFLTFTAFSTSHNAAASIFAVTAAYTLAQLLAGGHKGGRWWAALMALSVAVVLTVSRAFLVAMLVVFFAAILLWGSRRLLLGAACVAVLSIGLFGRDLVRRFVELRDPEEVRNVVLRLEYWERAADYIRRSPWLGVGFSRFNDVPAHEFAGVEGALQWKTDPPTVNDDAHAHNLVLMIWAETGLVGLGLWALFLGSLLREGRRRYTAVAAPAALRGLGRGAVMAFGLLLVASIVAYNIVTPSGVWPAGFFAGGMLACGVAGRVRGKAPAAAFAPGPVAPRGTAEPAGG